MAENKGFTLKTFGMPWWLAGAIAVIVIAAAATVLFLPIWQAVLH